MPVPTDTLWNIRRLNWIFAASAILLVLTIVWSILADYNKTWRKPQQNARVWEAALVDEKIQADTPDIEDKIAEFDKAIADATTKVALSQEQQKAKEAEIREIEIKRSNLEFSLNNL
jgi:hypothetical protein